MKNESRYYEQEYNSVQTNLLIWLFPVYAQVCLSVLCYHKVDNASRRLGKSKFCQKKYCNSRPSNDSPLKGIGNSRTSS